MKKKWVCDSCYKKFSTKKELVEDLKDHFESATQEASAAEAQLDELGVKNPYED